MPGVWYGGDYLQALSILLYLYGAYVPLNFQPSRPSSHRPSCTSASLQNRGLMMSVTAGTRGSPHRYCASRKAAKATAVLYAIGCFGASRYCCGCPSTRLCRAKITAARPKKLISSDPLPYASRVHML